jgi:hypothetical protein
VGSSVIGCLVNTGANVAHLEFRPRLVALADALARIAR